MEPAEIEYYVTALGQGYDVVKGSRHLRASGSLDLTAVRRLGNSALVGAVNVMWGCTFTDLCYGFFGFRREHLDSLALHARGFEIETELAVHAVTTGMRIAEVPSVELLRFPRTFMDASGGLWLVGLQTRRSAATCGYPAHSRCLTPISRSSRKRRGMRTPR